MSILRVVFGISLLVVGASMALAEEPPVPALSPEHEALGMWVGSWSGEGVMKAGPYGPGGPMAWTESCTWFEGSKFHVVCTSEGTSPMGPSKGLGIIGYNADRQFHTHYGVDNSGWSGYAEGTRTGDTWTYASEETVGDQVYRTRYAITKVSPTEVSFTWEMSEDETTWTVIMEGTSRKN